MSQCLRITFEMMHAKDSKEIFYTFIQKTARSFNLEGTVQEESENTIKIIVCGNRENLDDFVDALHKRATKEKIENIALEPFISDKDYRGVFRIIE